MKRGTARLFASDIAGPGLGMPYPPPPHAQVVDDDQGCHQSRLER